MFLFLEPIKNKLKDFTFFCGDEGDGFKKYETNFFPKNHPPILGWGGMVFRSNILSSTFQLQIFIKRKRYLEMKIACLMS